MVLKLSIFVIYLTILLRLGITWKKCRFALQGNEIILFQLVLPLALVVPCTLDVLLLRGCVHFLLFGICIFWHNMFPRGVGLVMKSAMVFMPLLILLELLVFVLDKAHYGSAYLVLGYVVTVFFFGTFLLRIRENKYMKSIFTMERLCNVVLYCVSPLMVCLGILVMLHSAQMNLYVSGMLSFVVFMLPLGYLFYLKPACMNYNEVVQIKRKAYLLGRAVKDGQLLEDGGGILNESVVDDARILRKIMDLFEEEKLYMNFDVKIGEVARRIGTNKTYLSRALNTRVSKNFCQFVNHYRIREVCLLYLENPAQEMRLLSEQCGFSSQSNFSIVFKYNTGYTPGDWCRLVRSKMEKNEPVQVDDYLL